MTGSGAERSAVARALAGAEPLDISAALALLNTVPDTADPSVREAVDHARRVVAAAPGRDHRHQAVARYMMARVAALLERTARQDANPTAQVRAVAPRT